MVAGRVLQTLLLICRCPTRDCCLIHFLSPHEERMESMKTDLNLLIFWVVNINLNEKVIPLSRYRECLLLTSLSVSRTLI